MKFRKALTSFLPAIIAAAALIIAAPASADNGVTVFAGPNSTCGIGGPGGSYTGTASGTIYEPDGSVKHQHCTGAYLVSGEPVSSTLVVQADGCTWTFMPSGRANSVCPKGF